MNQSTGTARGVSAPNFAGYGLQGQPQKDLKLNETKFRSQLG